MSLIKNCFIGHSKMACLSNAFSKTLLLAPRASITPSHLAMFATQSKNKSPQLVLPKKPMTSFFMFREENIEKIKRKNPKASVKELSVILGQQWKELDEGKKGIYQNRYASGMEDYKKQIEVIEADPVMNLKFAQLKEEKAQKSKEKQYNKAKMEKRALMKDLGRPKKTMSSPYGVFYTEKFASVHKKGDPVPNTTKHLSEVWKSLSDEKKEPYVAKYMKAKEVYDAELNAWKEKMAKNEETTKTIEQLNAKVNRKRKQKTKKEEAEE